MLIEDVYPDTIRKPSAMARLLIQLIRFYQRRAPLIVRNRCRYHPTCSQYTILAIEKYGGRKGMMLGWKRLRRCHPPFGGRDYP